jgi:GAF domain-containing protein/HAMP domain-containing protein
VILKWSFNSSQAAKEIQVKSTTSLEQKRYTKIQTRLAIAFALLAAAITLSISVVLYLQARKNLYSQYSDRVLSLVSLAELQQSPNLLSDVKSVADQDTATYRFLQQQLNRIVDSDPTLGSAYIIRRDEIGTIYYVLEAVAQNMRASSPPANFGDLDTSTGPILKETIKTLDKPIVETSFTTDKRGTWISAYAPIYRDDGTKEGILGMNLSVDALVTAERNMLISSILILVLALPIFAALGWVIGGRLARPIVDLTKGVQRITSGDLHYRVEIKSGDEVEALADSFNIMTGRVNELVDSLEQRVEARTLELKNATVDLEKSSAQIARRADQLSTVSDVAQAIASVQDVNELLDSVVRLISERFNFYHTGVFLIDDKYEYAILKAASSDGGKRMLARSHKLKVGEEGIVGAVTGSGKPRVALDTGEDATYFKNPDLPQTRSEMTLPLKIGERIIGALDVQSDMPNAFAEDDIKVLGTLANQVAVAIQNANLFAETRNALGEAQRAYQKFVQIGWKWFMEHSPLVGYQYTGSGLKPLMKPLDRPEIENAYESGQSINDTVVDNLRTIPALAVPIMVRGETIGVLDIRANDPKREWDAADLATAQTIADRLAFALENARLIEDSQKRVAREHAISDMTSRIGSSVDVSTILQQTVQELGKLIGNSEVVIQLSGDHPQAKE